MIQAIKIPGVLFAILALTLSLQGCASTNNDQLPDSKFEIAFKLDSRLLGPTYGGERWVPPPYGPIAYSGTYTLEARTYYIDADGRQFEVDAKWISADPKLVTVTPGKGNQVIITVQGLGETSLLVKTPEGTSKRLYIKATAQDNNINLVEISH